MKVTVSEDIDEHFYADQYRAVGITGVESPHNERPIGEFSVDLLEQWLGVLRTFEADTVYLWKADGPDRTPEHGESFHLVATPGRQPKAGVVIAGRVYDP